MPRSNASWITFGPRQVSIPANEKMVINYQIQVPASDSLSGTYWSVFMVEPTNPVEDVQKKNGISIRTVMRYAIQLITHIEDTGHIQIKFLNTNVIKEGKKRIMEIDIENTGERLARPFVWVEFYNVEGDHIGKFDGRIRRLYPSTSIRQKIDISAVPPDTYKALIIADCGNDEIFGINYTIRINE